MIEHWQLARTAPGRAAAVRRVRCIEAPHPLGVELRLIVDSSRGTAPNPGSVAREAPKPHSAPSLGEDLVRSEVFRERALAGAAAAAWRDAFERKGWRPPPPRFSIAAMRHALALTRHAQMRVPGDNAMGHVLSYRLKVMREALEVAIDEAVSLDWQARERRVIDAMTELARAERGPEGQAFVKPILDALR